MGDRAVARDNGKAVVPTGVAFSPQARPLHKFNYCLPIDIKYLIVYCIKLS